MDIETLLKNTSRSLYLSVQVLPRNMRPAFSIAYLLCRYADTIADTDLLDPARRLYWIKQFPRLLKEQNPRENALLVKEISGTAENPYEAELLQNFDTCLSQLNAIPVEQINPIMDVVQAVCEGMEIDLSFFPIEKTASPKAFEKDLDLKHYCRLMGGEPGRFWSRLIYQTEPVKLPEEEFCSLGRQIGDALQIVNILRDLPKDLRRGRCYFPLTDLTEAGLSPADLLAPKNTLRFEPVKRKWIHWGVENLKNGKHYFRQLSKKYPGQRAAVGWPVLWTADTLYKIYQATDLLNPKKRIKISRGTIYRTILLTPYFLWNNFIFEKWLDQKISRFS